MIKGFHIFSVFKKWHFTSKAVFFVGLAGLGYEWGGLLVCLDTGFYISVGYFNVGGGGV